MIKQLSREEQDRLHHRYRESDLFRQWSPLLCRLEWELQELDGISLWWEADKALQQLRQTQENRDEMIPHIFRRLLSDFRRVEDESGVNVVRTSEQAEQSAVTVMCLILTSLMNAVEKGHEEEDFDNQAMCVAIVGPLRSHPHFKFLMDNFFGRKKGNDGKKIVIKPSDPMKLQTIIENMDETAQKEVNQMEETIINYTNCLQTTFGSHWELWLRLCHLVCMDIELLGKLKSIEPRSNEWGINQKMICNMIGLFITKLQINVSTNSVSRMLSEKNLNSYLRNHSDYRGTDSALDKSQHLKIEQMISIN